MSDYIKREDAIKLCKPVEKGETDLSVYNFFRHATEIEELLADIPSADVVEREVYEALKEELERKYEPMAIVNKVLQREDLPQEITDYLFTDLLRSRYEMGR